MDVDRQNAPVAARVGLPGPAVRLQVLAFSGHTLEEQQGQLSWPRSRRPEILIIYCGHNEFSSRWILARDTRHYFDDNCRRPGLSFVEQIEAFSPLCGLIRETADKCRVAIPPPRTATGLWSTSRRTRQPSTRAPGRLPPAARGDRSLRRANRRGAGLDLAARQRRRIRAEPLVFASGNAASRSRAHSHAIFWPPARTEAADPAGAQAAYRALDRPPERLRRGTLSPGPASRPRRLVGRGLRALLHGPRRDGYPMRCLTDFRKFITRWPTVMGASWSTARLISMPSEITDSRTNTCSSTECTRRSAARSRWPRRSCTSFRRARPSAGRPSCPPPLIDPGECSREVQDQLIRLGVHLRVGHHVLRPDVPPPLRFEPSPRHEAGFRPRI